MNTATEIQENQSRFAAARQASGLTARSLILGVLLTILVDFWIQWVELIMGGRQGHTALANTSIPFGAFSAMFALSGLNILCRAILPGLAMSAAEVLVVYVMMTTSTVLSSSGQLQFIVPTITAAWHYATPENGWASSFHRFVPHWLAQTDPVVLHGFYNGHTALPLAGWLPQIGAWGGFLLALSAASLCIVAILRRQWVDRERLTFPTVALPLATVDPASPLLRNRLFWLGAAGPFLVSCMNTLALNIPAVPLLNLRANVDIGQMLTAPPWNAIGYTPISFYPFVVGIAYLIPTDVTFSCWFFFIVTRIERVVGSALGLGTGVAGVNQATFPALGHQGAGGISRADAGVFVAVAFLPQRRVGQSDGAQIFFGRHRRAADLSQCFDWSGAGAAGACRLVLGGGDEPAGGTGCYHARFYLHDRGDAHSGGNRQCLAVRAGRGRVYADDPDLRHKFTRSARFNHSGISAPGDCKL